VSRSCHSLKLEEQILKCKIMIENSLSWASLTKHVEFILSLCFKFGEISCKLAEKQAVAELCQAQFKLGLNMADYKPGK
jgi:hypothetical protein